MECVRWMHCARLTLIARHLCIRICVYVFVYLYLCIFVFVWGKECQACGGCIVPGLPFLPAICVYIFVYLYLCICVFLYLCIFVFVWGKECQACGGCIVTGLPFLPAVCVYAFCICICVFVYLCICVEKGMPGVRWLHCDRLTLLAHHNHHLSLGHKVARGRYMAGFGCRVSTGFTAAP